MDTVRCDVAVRSLAPLDEDTADRKYSGATDESLLSHDLEHWRFYGMRF